MQSQRRTIQRRHRQDIPANNVAVERLGEPVLVVEGDSRNIKITAQEDLDLVRAIMR